MRTPFQTILTVGLIAAVATSSHADIFRWDNRQLIPGTQGIAPGPGARFDHLELSYARLNELDLINSHWSHSNLNFGWFHYSTLANADFTGVNLCDANLFSANLTNANLTGARVTGANFSRTQGFRQEQLYSTASYKAKTLIGIGLGFRELVNWNFSGQDLSCAKFYYSNLAGANLTDAVVSGASFCDTTRRGFTKEQLYSTASYKKSNLQGMALGENDLSDWDFSVLNLTNASFTQSMLTHANLAEAVVAGASFYNTTSRGFTKEELYSSASYKQKNLRGIYLGGNDLSSWDFSDQCLAAARFDGAKLADANLTGANLMNAIIGSDLTNADLAGADLTNASFAFFENDGRGWSTLTNSNLTGTVVKGANLHGETAHGFTKWQLYSTASYQDRNLQGIRLSGNDLAGWGLQGLNLTDAYLLDSTLTNANLTGADTRGAQYMDLTGALSRNAILPDGTVQGLNLMAGEQFVLRNYQGYQGDLYPAHGPIPVTIQDHMTTANGGVLQLLFDADAWDSTISFQPGIPVTLGGTLELIFAPNIKVGRQIGRTFRVFDWTGVNRMGQFQVAGPYVWDLTKLYTTGEVTLTAVSSDADHDGLPDAWELTYWPTTDGHGALDDFDHDGTPELLELAFGLNPTLSDTGGLPPATNEGGYLTMTITRHPGVIYEIQTAGTLEAGQPDSFSPATTTVLIDTATTLKVRDNYPIGTSSRRFIRARVTAAR